MSPPTAGTASRRSRGDGRGSSDRRAASKRAARRRQAARRRRGALWFTGVIIVAIAVVVAMPLFRKAVNAFTLPLAHADIIRQQAADKHLDPALIAAVIYAETKFDARTSAAGAEGLMQILPQTAAFLARRSGATTFTVADLGTPQVNIAYGSYYLRYLLDHYGNNELLAIAAYNGGLANVDRWAARASAVGHRLTVDEIPFSETRAYAQKVLQAQRDYRRTYPTQLGY
jgi:soluble lytic murein transglycosylase